MAGGEERKGSVSVAILKGKQTKGYGIFTDADGDPAVKHPSGTTYKCTIKRHYPKAGETNKGGYIALFNPDGASCQHGLRLRLKETGFFIERLFSWLDADNDGFITVEELAVHLDVPIGEARMLVDEVHSGVSAANGGKRDKTKLTKEDFKLLFESHILNEQKGATAIPERLLKRYRKIFEDIDSSDTGTITFDELATALGIEDVEDALTDLGISDQDNNALNFEAFAALMHRSADKNRAGRAFKQLFQETDETHSVMQALDENMRLQNPDLSLKPTVPGMSKRVSRRTLRSAAGMNAGDSLLDGEINQLKKGPVLPKLPVEEDEEALNDIDIPPIVRQVWEQVQVDEEGQASYEDVVGVIDSMGAEGLGITDDELASLPFELMAASEDGRLDMAALWDSLPIYQA